MPAFSVNQLALGVGAGGALVDVSDYVKGTEGVTYAYGRQDEFRDPSPGVITFTLENQDGRFTPGNAASPLATLLSEGTAACWNLGGRLVTGQVTAVGFAASEDQWGRISVTCGDVFQAANRTAVTDLSHDMASASAYLFWPLDDDPTSVVAVEANGGPSLQPDVLFPSLVTFGATSTTPSPDTQVTLTNAAVELEYFGTGGATGPASFPTINYPAGSLGFWGFWATPFTGQGAQLNVAVAAGWQTSLSFSPSRVAVVCIAGTGTNVNVGVNWEVGSAHYIAFSLTYVGTLYTLSLFIDGVLAGSSTLTWSPFVGPTNADFQPDSVRFQVGDGVSIQSVGLSHLSHSSVLVHEEAAGVTTEAARVTALASLVPGMTIGSLDANLSTAPVAGSVTNAWSGLCDVLRTEQGHLYAVTSGSLLSPSTVVNMRARTRPATPSATFDAQADLSGLPQFIRDVTNMFATIAATGPDDSASVTDAAVIPRVGSASSSETVLLEGLQDLLGYAQDRMLRGENVALRAAQVTIDTLTTSAATQAAVLGLTPGDRVRISNLPSAQLGFTSWDGWFLGASEVHAPGPSAVDVFTLYLAPVLPRTAVFDTDEFMAGGELTLTSALGVTGGSTLFTNLFTNPSFETASGTVTVRTNRATNPNAVGATGFSPNNGARNTVTRNVTVTGHPQGITTAASSVVNAGQTTPVILSAFNMDSMGNTSAARYEGAWVLVTGSGYQAGWAVDSTSLWVTLTANVWTWVAANAIIPANTYSSFNVEKISGNAPTSDVAYVTGVTADANAVPTESIWGGRAAAGDFGYAWTGTANASTSTQTAPGVAGAGGANCAGVQSADWAGNRTHSIRLTQALNGAARAVLTFTFTPGHTYTVKATKRQSAVLTDYHGNYNGMMYVQTGGAGAGVVQGPQAANIAGTQDLTWTFTVPADATSIAFALGYGASIANAGDVWWDEVAIVDVADVAHPYTGPYFDGSTTDTGTVVYSWTGTADATTSVEQVAVWPTTMSVTSGDSTTWLEQVAVPYTLELDAEQVTVTAAAAPSGTTQTATITRGVNGTTPATHAAGIPVDLAVPALFAF